MIVIQPGLRQGAVVPPPSKSHLHRLLIADFLGEVGSPGRPYASGAVGSVSRPYQSVDLESDDIKATRRCLAALADDDPAPILDCGESGSTLRFMAPIAAALGKRPVFKKAGRLAERPMLEYPELKPGLHELAGDVSSQFVTGLLFALPLLDGDSAIRFTTPLESRGYVAMTLAVLKDAGVVVRETENGYDVPGNQVYRARPDLAPEADWSGAAFWHVANAIGNRIAISGMNEASAQPDRRIVEAVKIFGSPSVGPRVLEMSEFPDSFPVLTIAAACTPGETVFTGIRRLRIKESDRVAAMADALARFGVATETTDARFVVRGATKPLRAGAFTSFGDHRIAMSIAIGATRADGPVEIDDAACAAKSYPGFFAEFESKPFLI